MNTKAINAIRSMTQVYSKASTISKSVLKTTGRSLYGEVSRIAASTAYSRDASQTSQLTRQTSIYVKAGVAGAAILPQTAILISRAAKEKGFLLKNSESLFSGGCTSLENGTQRNYFGTCTSDPWAHQTARRTITKRLKATKGMRARDLQFARDSFLRAQNGEMPLCRVNWDALHDKRYYINVTKVLKYNRSNVIGLRSRARANTGSGIYLKEFEEYSKIEDLLLRSGMSESEVTGLFRNGTHRGKGYTVELNQDIFENLRKTVPNRYIDTSASAGALMVDDTVIVKFTNIKKNSTYEVGDYTRLALGTIEKRRRRAVKGLRKNGRKLKTGVLNIFRIMSSKVVHGNEDVSAGWSVVSRVATPVTRLNGMAARLAFHTGSKFLNIVTKRSKIRAALKLSFEASTSILFNSFGMAKDISKGAALKGISLADKGLTKLATMSAKITKKTTNRIARAALTSARVAAKISAKTTLWISRRLAKIAKRTLALLKTIVSMLTPIGSLVSIISGIIGIAIFITGIIMLVTYWNMLDINSIIAGTGFSQLQDQRDISTNQLSIMSISDSLEGSVTSIRSEYLRQGIKKQLVKEGIDIPEYTTLVSGPLYSPTSYKVTQQVDDDTLALFSAEVQNSFVKTKEVFTKNNYPIENFKEITSMCSWYKGLLEQGQARLYSAYPAPTVRTYNDSRALTGYVHPAEMYAGFCRDTLDRMIKDMYTATHKISFEIKDYDYNVTVAMHSYNNPEDIIGEEVKLASEVVAEYDNYKNTLLPGKEINVSIAIDYGDAAYERCKDIAYSAYMAMYTYCLTLYQQSGAEEYDVGLDLDAFIKKVIKNSYYAAYLHPLFWTGSATIQQFKNASFIMSTYCEIAADNQDLKDTFNYEYVPETVYIEATPTPSPTPSPTPTPSPEGTEDSGPAISPFPAQKETVPTPMPRQSQK